MSVSVRVRFEVFKRDGFTCAYCGRRAPDVLLEVDHLIPRAAGGSDEIENLITACWDCNRGKSDRLIDETTAPVVSPRVLEDAEDRVAQAKAYAEAVQSARDLQGRFEDMVNEAWANAFGATTKEQDGQVSWAFEGLYGRFPSSGSLRRILRRLPVMDVLEAVDITASKFRRANADAERYFFGVCWRKVTEHESGPR